MHNEIIERLLLSRQRLSEELGWSSAKMKAEEEGGCGVVGFCCSQPMSARNIYEPSKQMHNRGNGKGGGISALGFIPEQLGVSRQILDDNYMLHIAVLDPAVKAELERKYIVPGFDVSVSAKLDAVDDWTAVEGLEVKPPDVWRYFVRAKKEALDSFVAGNGLQQLSRDEAEKEFLHQNSLRLNQEYYASLGEKKAFVLSEGKNIMILKVVGYAEAITRYYKIDDLRAHAWIAHQRFPTKGRVWHPAGAHPFSGVNAALVHNGDFANYLSVCEYLAQRHIYPQFLTDTEVSILLFDLLSRTYHYPLEYIIEAMAPTTELDFDRLPVGKQKIYRSIQAAHIHGSPDGPWFFIIARNIPEEKKFQLMGITDTAMLRPQVFAFCDGEVQVGLICSEKQAIDATLLSLSKEDNRICPVADKYWNARGGSHNDGGAFIFTLEPDHSGQLRMTCTDKFGSAVPMPSTKAAEYRNTINPESLSEDIKKRLAQGFESNNASLLSDLMIGIIPRLSDNQARLACQMMADWGKEPANTGTAIAALTLLNDRRYSTGQIKRNHLIHMIRNTLSALFNSIPRLDEAGHPGSAYRLIDFESRSRLRPPQAEEETLVINTRGFPAEGDESDASLLMEAYIQGWKHFISFNCAGQRFIGCGLGPQSEGVTIDVYDSSGDYLASGIDGLTLSIHANAQDQLGQIMKSGKLVIYGDTGQTFLYGAKGGSVYVMGNAAGRPLINSVGTPRVIINGTCLDFLAESFMAGDVLNGGGFVILNGVSFDDEGRVVPLKEPYPGSNLFSLASGGAIYIRDPGQYVVPQQLNGGEFFPLTEADWELILDYLKENERLFGIKVEDLLTVGEKRLTPAEVYRKVAPARKAAAAAAGSNSKK